MEKQATVQVREIPLRIYDASRDRYVQRTLGFDARKSREDYWKSLMLYAQVSGRRINHSNEWFLGRRYLQEHDQQAEEDFITEPREWTGTVLDFDHEEILEGIVLNPDGSIATVATRLTPREGFHLPSESGYIKDFPPNYTKTLQHLWGVKDPKRELPDYTYLYVTPTGFRPVVRGHWALFHRGYRRVDADADYGAARWRFAARFVSEATKAEEKAYRMSMPEYQALVKKVEELEKGLDEIRNMLSKATIIG